MTGSQERLVRSRRAAIRTSRRLALDLEGVKNGRLWQRFVLRPLPINGTFGLPESNPPVTSSARLAFMT